MFGSRCSGISSSQVNEGEMEREKNIFYNCEIEGDFCSIMKVPLASKFGGIFSFFQNLCGYIPYTGSHFALKLHLKKPNSNDHFNIIVEYGEYLTKLSERDAHNNNNKKSKFYYVGKDGLRFYVIDDLIKEIDNALYNLENEKAINKIIEQLKNIPFDPTIRDAQGVYNIPSSDYAIRELLDILKSVIQGRTPNREDKEKIDSICTVIDSFNAANKDKISFSFNDQMVEEGKITKTATYDAEGVKTFTCTTCGQTKTEKIAKLIRTDIGKISVLGIKNKTYNGKKQTQSLTIKLGNKTLKNGTDFSITYKNNTNVGTATAIITGKGAYTGKVSKTFNINPKGTSLKKLTAGKKQFKATWNAQKTQTTGYLIQYSTNKNFKSGKKTVKIKKNKTTSSTVKKLKAKKKYYVRIRTYKNVNGKTYYSGWSKVKNVITKK